MVMKKGAKKSAAKKPAAKKAAPKKAAKKAVAKKKPAAKKPAAKKTAAKKTVAKKTAAKKTAAKKTTAKKAAPKKAAAKKTATKKTSAKKAAPKKAAAKKTVRKAGARRAKAAPAATPAASEGGEPSEPDGESGLLSSPFPAPRISGLIGGEEFNAASVSDKWIVLYFYPKDMTPGCTVEARDFQSLTDAFKLQDAVVIGVSKDSCQSHSRFAQKEGLSFMLLSDEKSDLCERYGVWKQKSMYGKTFMGIERSTFLISPRGEVVAHWPKVKVDGHASAVLATLSKLNR